MKSRKKQTKKLCLIFNKLIEIKEGKEYVNLVFDSKHAEVVFK